jgi:DNA-binding beta-propeller fold protein YncE
MPDKTQILSLPFLLALLLLAGCATPQQPREIKLLAFPPAPEQPRYYYERTLVTANQVKGQDSESRLRALLTGEKITGGAPFGKPYDVAVHKGRVFITDTVHRAVIVMDFVEGKSFHIGDRGDEGDLSKPLGIAVDDQGNLFVSDSTLKTVVAYDRNGQFLRSIGGDDLLERPAGIDVNPQGTRLYVVDVGGVSSQNHRIQVFNTQTGELVRTIGTRGNTEGTFNLPRDVTLGKDGLLYVTDGGNFRIQVLTQEGEFVRSWGRPGARMGNFSRPKGIATDKDGYIYAVDTAFGNFQVFNSEGQLMIFVGERSEVPGPARYMLPAGIDIDEDGRIYMVDQYYKKVDIYRPASLKTEEGYMAVKDR